MYFIFSPGFQIVSCNQRWYGSKSDKDCCKPFQGPDCEPRPKPPGPPDCKPDPRSPCKQPQPDCEKRVTVYFVNNIV